MQRQWRYWLSRLLLLWMPTFHHASIVHNNSHHSALAPQLLGSRARHRPIWTIKQAVKEWAEDPVKALETNVDIADWDTREVKDMSELFMGEDFDEDISRWDVSNVRRFYNMFAYAKVFNQDISSWNTANATNMYDMFAGADAFNKDYIKDWANKPPGM